MSKFDELAESNKEELKEAIRATVKATFEDKIDEAVQEKYGDKEEEQEEQENEDDEEEDELSEAAGKGKLIHTEKSGNKEAKVYWSSAEQEYTVSLFVGGTHQKNADYFTDDKDDAKGTAKQMLK